ncbi:PQQ-dependent sugar dehydrogenase [Sphingoaurantiacus capsulatus]|uniref:PQQ-dependent sugar dehydrogenase n=1 Tax=Sphingoaurantiacus capsulatus TaxID=1771310 RepID=A0ABV7X9M0_9SPHN
MIKRAMTALLAPLLLAAGGPPTVPHRITTMATGLDHPWSVAFLPDGRVLVTERAGRLRVISGGKLQAKPIAGVPAVYENGQGGLFDVLPHPDFATNRLLFLSYAAGTPKANATRIARARLDGDSLTDVKVIFEVAPLKNTPAHYGGRMAWLRDGSLVMTTGDGFDYREAAQRKDGLIGKTIRIRPDGKIPSDNPFVGVKGARPEIWSLGHRNPQGLAVDPATGTLWQHEHGPQGGDEVNLIRRSANYGWPVATYGRDYSGAGISPFKTYKNMVDGVLTWTPSIAPSGLAVYRGAMFPEWQGDLIVGALAHEHVRRVDLNGTKVVGQQRLFPDLTARIRDVRVAPDGAIWLTVDEDEGRVLRVTRK